MVVVEIQEGGNERRIHSTSNVRKTKKEPVTVLVSLLFHQPQYIRVFLCAAARLNFEFSSDLAPNTSPHLQSSELIWWFVLT